MPTPTANFDELRSVIRSLPILGETDGSDGNLADWLTRVRGQAVGNVTHPRIVVFAATHGIAALLPGSDGEGMTQAVEAFVADSPVHDFAAAADSDLRLYDLALERPTQDSRLVPAMDEVETSRAAAYGMMAVEPGVDLFVVSALGAGAVVAGTALSHALAHGAVSPESQHAALIAPAIARHGALDDPLELLAALGGPDTAAILGLILAARLARIPVILDGVAALAAASVAHAIRADAIDHCRLATGGDHRLSLLSILSLPPDAPVTGAKALVGLKSLFPQ